MNFFIDNKISDATAEEIIRTSIDFINDERSNEIDISSETLFVKFMKEKKYEFIDKITNVDCGSRVSYPSIYFYKNGKKYFFRFTYTKVMLYNYELFLDNAINPEDVLHVCPRSIYFIDYLI